MKNSLLCLLFFLACIFVSCQENDVAIPMQFTFAHGTSKELVLGETFFFIIDITSSDTEKNPTEEIKELFYSSSDENVITVTSEGLTKAVGVGTATITATLTTTKGAISTASCICTIIPRFSIVQDHLSLELGDIVSTPIKLNGPYITAGRLEYKSSDENVATVDKDYIVARGEGICTIYIEDYVHNYVDSLEVTVKPVVLESIDFDTSSIEMKTGDKYTLYLSFHPLNATNKNVTVISSDENVAIVTNSDMGSNYYNVIGTGIGDCVITATSENGDVKTECKVSVLPVSIASIKFDNLSDEQRKLCINDSFDLSPYYSINPKDATNKEVEWSSSNENIISVSQEGIVKANKLGNAIITVTSKDNPNVTSSIKLSVVNISDKISLYIGFEGMIVNNTIYPGSNLKYYVTNNSQSKKVYIRNIYFYKGGSMIDQILPINKELSPKLSTSTSYKTINDYWNSPWIYLEFDVDGETYSIKYIVDHSGTLICSGYTTGIFKRAN